MQNCRLWTAGSISRKLRGVRAKIWAELEIVLNYKGVRVDFGKGQGLFSKTASRRGMGDSLPSDLDLVAQIKGLALLIWRVDLRSNGGEPTLRAGRRRLTAGA